MYRYLMYKTTTSKFSYRLKNKQEIWKKSLPGQKLLRNYVIGYEIT